MLYSLVAVAAICLNVVFGLNTSVPLYNNVTSNFIIWLFNGGGTYFPYAMDKCHASGLTTTSGYKFTCAADKMSVTLETHNDYTCTDPDPLKTMINSTGYMDEGSSFMPFGYDTSMDMYRTKRGAFECNGIEAYASVSFAINSCAQLTSTIYAALDVCENTPALGTGSYPAGRALNLYCDSTEARMQYWLTPEYPMCDGAMTQETNYAYPTCGYMFAFSGLPIYGKLNECKISSSMTTTMSGGTTTMSGGTTTMSGATTTTGSGGESDANIINYCISTIICLFIVCLLF
jgi:hypothetical protein